ncbi:MAG: hypothetical protein M0D55_12765 [Elusimicrobiota bacterium]|nr:MAG: hypothetical protein M0D55_12765 [Elusimicrobiota bacterium]
MRREASSETWTNSSSENDWRRLERSAADCARRDASAAFSEAEAERIDAAVPALNKVTPADAEAEYAGLRAVFDSDTEFDSDREGRNPLKEE